MMIWKEHEIYGRFKVLTVVNTEIAAFYDMTRCSQGEAVNVLEEPAIFVLDRYSEDYISQYDTCRAAFQAPISMDAQ
jgi:hypothetical protein